jgi:hypothetical protein
MDQDNEQPEDDFGGAADIVRSMPYSGAASQPVDPISVSRSMGFGSIGGIGTHQGTKQYQQAVQVAQASSARSAAQAKPISPEAQFYASVGDMSGAVALQKSKGPSLFTHGEEYDFGNSAGKYAITPAGDMTMVDSSGNLVKGKVSDYAWQSGIKTVPFRGGDQNASLFRQTMQKASETFQALDKLEQLYKENFAYIGKANPSATSATAEQVETEILLGASSILTGTKSLGGGTSNTDIEMVQKLVPKAASTWFTNTKGNELERLKYLRTMLNSHISKAALSNGIMLKNISKKTGPDGRPPGVL